MGIRKILPRRLEHWCQVRRRGLKFLLMGKYLGKDIIFIISVHETPQEAHAHGRAYMAARLEEQLNGRAHFSERLRLGQGERHDVEHADQRA